MIDFFGFEDSVNRANTEVEWQMTPEQTFATVSTLGILVVLYSAIIYHAVQNSYNFLYKQKRYRVVLLTAFYTFTILTCVCRVAQYLYLVLFYFTQHEQRTTEFLLFDMVTAILMLCVGCVMVLFNVSLTHAVQYVTGHRRKVPPIALILTPLLAVSVVMPTLSMIFTFKYTFYLIALFDISVALGLFLSLWYMNVAMDRVPELANFDGKNMSRIFVITYGFSFITFTGCNIAKSLYFDKYNKDIQNNPYIFSSISFFSNLLNQILPLVLMIVMHRKNFKENSPE